MYLFVFCSFETSILRVKKMDPPGVSILTALLGLMYTSLDQSETATNSCPTSKTGDVISQNSGDFRQLPRLVIDHNLIISTPLPKKKLGDTCSKQTRMKADNYQQCNAAILFPITSTGNSLLLRISRVLLGLEAKSRHLNQATAGQNCIDFATESFPSWPCGQMGAEGMLSFQAPP